MISRYRREHPSAMACLEDDLEASLNHLRLPATHRKTVRTTNLCERSFVEQRRRAKVIPRFRSERECLKLVFASLWRASERWKKVKFTAAGSGRTWSSTSRPVRPRAKRSATSSPPRERKVSGRCVYRQEWT